MPVGGSRLAGGFVTVEVDEKKMRKTGGPDSVS